MLPDAALTATGWEDELQSVFQKDQRRLAFVPHSSLFSCSSLRGNRVLRSVVSEAGSFESIYFLPQETKFFEYKFTFFSQVHTSLTFRMRKAFV